MLDMGPINLKTKPRSIGFDGDENGQSRQVQYKIPIHLYVRVKRRFTVIKNLILCRPQGSVLFYLPLLEHIGFPNFPAYLPRYGLFLGLFNLPTCLLSGVSLKNGDASWLSFLPTPMDLNALAVLLVEKRDQGSLNLDPAEIRVF